MNKPFKVYLVDNLYKDLILYDSLFHPKRPQQTISYPSYSIVCSDSLGVQNLDVSTPSQPYYVIPSSIAEGIATIFFYNTNDDVIGSQVITFNNLNKILITPVSNTVMNRYAFRCTSFEINIVCNDTEVLEPTFPYTFKNDTVDTILLELLKSGGGFVGITLNPGDSYTPTPPYGFIQYTTTC